MPFTAKTAQAALRNRNGKIGWNTLLRLTDIIITIIIIIMEEGLLSYSYCCADIANIVPCTHSSTKLTSLLHCRPTSHFIVCISDLEAGSQHSFHFVIPTHITLRCSFSIFPSPFWDWFSSCFAFEKRASLLHRSMVALDRKDPLGQAATFLSPPCGSPE